MISVVGNFASSFSDDFMRLMGKLIGGVRNLIDFILDVQECGLAKGLFLLLVFVIFTAILALVYAAVFSIFVSGGSALIFFSVISAVLAGAAANKLKNYVKISLCK